MNWHFFIWLLELGLSDIDAHELKYVFDTAHDLPRVEAVLKFHEQKVSNKNVDLSFDNNEVDYSAWDDHSFGDIDYEEEDLEILERHVLAWNDIGYMPQLNWYGASCRMSIIFLNKR